MNSRMERYNSENKDILNEDTNSRVSRNNSLYQDIKTNELSRVRNNSNIKIIEGNGKTINIDKIKKYIAENNLQPREGRKSVVVDNNEEQNTVLEEVKVKDYDINSVLEKAKQNREIDYERERYKKLRDTQYDILSKIEMYQKDQPLKEEEDDEFNTDERTLIDLINTVTIHKGDVNLLEELVGGEDEEITLPIEEEKEKAKTDIKDDLLKETIDKKKQEEVEKTQELVNLKEKAMDIDKSFYTNSMSFSKEDFEGFEELEKSVKKNGVLTTIIMIILIIFIILTLIIMANYVFELGLF